MVGTVDEPAFPIVNQNVRPSVVVDESRHSTICPDVTSTEVLRPQEHADYHQERKLLTRLVRDNLEREIEKTSLPSNVAIAFLPNAP